MSATTPHEPGGRVDAMQGAGLSLRFRGGTVPDAPPDVAAFSGGRRTRAAAVREGLSVLGGSPGAAMAPLVIFFRAAAFGIPPIQRVAAGLPDLEDWALRPVLPGWVAAVPTRGRRRSALWVVAACLPLALATEAAAAPAKPKVQRPSVLVPDAPGEESGAGDEAAAAADADDPKPPALPDRNPGEGTDPEAEGADDEGEGEGADEAEADSDATDESESEEHGPPPPPDPFVGSARTRNQATLDAAWDGVDGRAVNLRLKGGKTMRGVVGAVQRDTFTLIEADTGVVVVLPKSGVASLRVMVPDPLPEQTGTGMLVGGGILTTVGVPVLISGIAILAVCPSCVGINVTLLLLGGGGVGSGIPLLIRGSERRQAYRAALLQRQAIPTVGRVGGAWTGGIRFRF